MEKVSVNIGGHTTSFSIETEFLDVLKGISQKENKSLNKIVSEIDENRGNSNLSSAIRLFILKKLK